MTVFSPSMGAGVVALFLSAVFHVALLLVPTPRSRLSDPSELVDVNLLAIAAHPEDPTPPIATHPDEGATYVPVRANPIHSSSPEGLSAALPRPVAPLDAMTAGPAAASMPRFTIAISATLGDDHGSVAASVAVPGGEAAAPMSEQAVDEPARILRSFAVYPAGARADGVEGVVGLELVVAASGSVESARVVRPAGHGLDEAALAAAPRFSFTPAKKAGRPVRVRMGFSVEFALQ
jgi:TonB family protein